MKKLFALLFLLLPLFVFGQSKESKQLFKKGVELFDAKKFDEALTYFMKCDSLDKAILKPTHKNYYRAELKMADCQDELSSTKIDIGDVAGGLQCLVTSAETRKRILGDNSPEYAKSMSSLAGYYILLGKYSEALELATKAAEIQEKTIGKQHNDYATTLEVFSLYYYCAANLTEALKAAETAKEITLKNSGRESQEYLSSLSCLMMSLSGAGRYDEAIETVREQMEIQRKMYGENDKRYASSLLSLALYSYQGGKYKDAVKYGKEGLKLQSEILGENNFMQSTAFSNVSMYCAELGDYAEALRLAGKSAAITKNTLGTESSNYATVIGNMAADYHYLGNYTESLRLETEAAEIRKRIFGTGHPNYAVSLINLAGLYYDMGNYTEAIRLATSSAEILKASLGEEHPYYASSINNLATYYSSLGNNEEAVRLQKLTAGIRKKVLGEEHPDYGLALNNLSSYYSDAGEHDEAIKLCSQSAEIFKNAKGSEHPDYASVLNNLASVYSKAGNHDEAIRLGSQAMEIRKKALGTSHPDYVNSLFALSVLYYDSGNYDDAVKFGQKAVESSTTIYVKEHPLCAEALKNLGRYYFAAGNYDEASSFYKQGFARTTALVLKNFSSMTYKERTDFWKTHSDFFCNELPYAACGHSDTALSSLAYDSQVFSKGLLLNAELEMQKIIETSGDTAFVKRYYKIRNDRSVLDKLFQVSADKRELNADSLQKVIDEEELLLLKSSQELGDYTKNLSVGWKDIQNSLGINDLAVEFANFRDTASKKDVYIALVLKKDMTAPETVKLFDGTDFEKINSKEYYKNTDFYNLVWKKLEKYLSGVNNVYFSPSGIMHTTGIEYLPDESGKIFAEKFNVYRLSSTRELALEHKQNPNKKAATYGGIKYDFNKSDSNVRSVVTYLKGTKIESATVAKLLRSADFSVIAFYDTLATEESFKKLSGSGLKILHIGTHGFYLSEDVMERNGLGFLASGGLTKEERSLSCSGLLFAGANFALDTENRSALPEGDDGILTAKEISRLDFKGLDLVVLSACQTGLGEVTGEGVFGLQRGFKKAGAQTIIMSLWEVDDYATRLLMTEFFKGLTAGKSKREAFLSALNYVKAKNSDPKYWAAFVMVDGE